MSPTTPGLSLTFRRRIWLLFTLAWTAALLVPIPFKEPPIPGWPAPIFTLSKTLHVLAYAFFTMLSGWLLLPPRQRSLILVFLMGHAMFSEWGQHLLRSYSGRTGQWTDVALDCLGILLGMVLTWKWWSGANHTGPNRSEQ